MPRWPNDGTVKIGELQVKDGHKIHGIQGSMRGVFSCEGDRPKRWAGEKDVMLHGDWFWDWADQRCRVETIDTEKRIITLPAKLSHAFGFRKGQWYYAYNLLCELDRPGEWHLDRETGTLYFWPPTTAPTNGQAVVSVLPSLVNMTKTSYVALRGFTLEGCRGTAVTLSGGHDDQFSSAHIFGNVFVRVTSAAFIGGGKDSVIENNVFVDCNPAIYVDARGLGWQSQFHTSFAKQLETPPFREEPWRSRYPKLLTILDDPDRSAPKRNIIVRNIQ